MAFIKTTFSYKSLLTSLKMSNLQNNFAEMANGGSNAPTLKGAAVANSVTFTSGSYHIPPNSAHWYPGKGLWMFAVDSSYVGSYSGSYPNGKNLRAYFDITAADSWAFFGALGRKMTGPPPSAATTYPEMGLVFAVDSYFRFTNPEVTTSTIYYIKVD